MLSKAVSEPVAAVETVEVVEPVIDAAQVVDAVAEVVEPITATVDKESLGGDIMFIIYS